mmetsp:Transcript_33418/g.78129  ORF Transcript_33418/g.78129 Transcript_33418/m.78129 type:complete len:164 (+) Transcript_33418:76-567(+)
MQVFLRTLEGETCIIEAEDATAILSVVATQEPAVRVALSSGRYLQAGESLSEAGLQAGSTLFVVPQLLGGGDGTPAMGKRHKKTHMLCARCGKRSFHVQKKRCASCGYPDKKMRGYRWSIKSNRRRAPGTGRMKHLRHMPRRFKNGFREGTTPPARKKNTQAK